MGPSFRLLALPLLVALAGCGTMIDDQAASPQQRLYRDAYRQISATYIDPVSTEALATAGLKRLSRLDPAFAIERRGTEMVLSRGSVELQHMPAPAPDDIQKWGSVTAQFIATAKTASPEMAGKTDDQIDDVVLNGALTVLDRFSQYARPDAARERRAERNGFSGIGIGLEARGPDIRITSVMADSPAGRAGLKKDDRLLSIDGKPTMNLSTSELAALLRGVPGTAVALTVMRPPASEPFSVSMARAFLIVPTVTSSHDLHNAVFHVSSFNHLTTTSLTAQLKKVRSEMGPTLKGIILDLRNNRGGLLDQAIDMASLFLDNGTVMSITGRHPEIIKRFDTTPRGLADGLPIAVLVNGGSASSAEVVAAALQDTGRAVVIGSSSFGKGTAQTVLRLPNDGELTITSARMIAPGGYSLNEHGVVPTICTADLNDQPAGVTLALRRSLAALGAGLASRPRAMLDEAGWSELRRQCPAQRTEPSLDLRVASRILGDSTLYRQTLGAAASAVAVAP